MTLQSASLSRHFLSVLPASVEFGVSDIQPSGNRLMLCLTLDHHIKLPSPVNTQVRIEISHEGEVLPMTKGPDTAQQGTHLSLA